MSQVQAIMSDVKNASLSPVYLLMGEEAYYPEMVCDAIVEGALDESERDFNQSIYYGSDVNMDDLVSAAMRYPMMADKQLVVLKEAQLLKDKELEKLALYCANPLDTTILVILLHGANADKRKALYKNIQKNGVVLESPAVRDYEITNWIISYFDSRNINIDPQAAQLFGEYAGTDLGKIAVETDKMLKNLPEGVNRVTVEDIEKNVGISRQYSVFELSKALSFKDASQAIRIAVRVGSTANFHMAAAISALFMHFNRVLKCEAMIQKNPDASRDEKARVLGINPFFLREYETAMRNYPIPSCMKVISLLTEYDFKGKGGNVGPDTPQSELLVELVTKIINV